MIENIIAIVFIAAVSFFIYTRVKKSKSKKDGSGTPTPGSRRSGPNPRKYPK